MYDNEVLGTYIYVCKYIRVHLCIQYYDYVLDFFTWKTYYELHISNVNIYQMDH